MERNYSPRSSSPYPLLVLTFVYLLAASAHSCDSLAFAVEERPVYSSSVTK